MMIFVNVCSTWSMVELKTRFETWLRRNDVNGVGLFHLSYLTIRMDKLCSQRTTKVQIIYFMIDWSIYRLFVLNTDWKPDPFKIIIFVYICFTWGMLELKRRFEMWITRNDVNGVRLLHFSYLTTRVAYKCSQMTPNVQIMYFMFHWSIYRLFLLNRGWKRDSLQMMIIVNVCSTCNMVELKTRFETWITRNDVNVRLFHLSNLITLRAYLCSQWTTKIQIKYFMFDWSICRLFVINRGWKRNPLQIMIFVYFCSTWDIVELKTRFETWITMNDVNGISLFHLSYPITLMAYLCLQRTPNVQIKYFMFDWSIYALFVLNTGWKRVFLQMMIFVNVYATYNMADLKTRFETWIK
jgi:hypothetical protein